MDKYYRCLGALAGALALITGSVEAQSGLVVFETSIPDIPSQLQLYQLETRSTAAAAAVRVAPRMVAQVGDVQIYPTLRASADARSVSIGSRAQIAKLAVPALRELIALDDTTAAIGATRVLMHARARRAGSDVSIETATPKLLYVSARRRVGGYDVEGLGSRAMVAIDPDGVVRGASLQWKPAKRSRSVNAAFRADQLKAEIAVQVEARLRQQNASRAYVSDVRLVYYDGHRNILQPAFRFVARFESDRGESELDWPAYVIGYVPFAAAADAGESIPSFRGDDMLPAPALAPAAASVLRNPTATKMAEIHVHRYVARNVDFGFTLSANQFWDALASSPLGDRVRDGQYFYSEPRLFTRDMDHFVNGAEVVLAAGHGRRSAMATNSSIELVEFADVQPGYGPQGSGRLNHLILHSCSIFGPETDADAKSAEWTKPWWSLFDGGMTTAVGYRSLMYINDGATLGFAERLGAGAPVVSSWFNEVASLPAYGDNPHGCDAHLSKPFGRAAAVARCDFDGTIADRAAPASTDCLDGFWFADSLSRLSTPERVASDACDPACETGGARYCAPKTIDDYQPELTE